jgi:hypothetical protein
MDIEQLKLVLETVKAVSGDTATVAIIWITVQSILPFIIWVLGLTLTYKAVVKFVGKSQYTEDIKLLRDSLGIGIPGAINPSEYSKTLCKLHELIHKEKIEKASKVANDFSTPAPPAPPPPRRL